MPPFLGRNERQRHESVRHETEAHGGDFFQRFPPATQLTER